MVVVDMCYVMLVSLRIALLLPDERFMRHALQPLHVLHCATHPL
eukprot:CAMPEP_0179421200 /NCGR_PEP_ID=MMETSP0799-20121207/9623_1 /TAXON_ID=46947 /ORGANISM="Geminigera cryophila, Strain CCMP2564" /LENGTH=43 /DNA_ID= /DNA_START= /DNA_END= /DNA_ORIENTATION=